MNPLRSNVNLSPAGLESHVQELLLGEIVRERDRFLETLAERERAADAILSSFPPLAGLDITAPDDADAIREVMDKHRGTREWWAFWVGCFLYTAKTALNCGDHILWAWNIACAERCRSMMIYKEELEEAMYMGHSAKRIIDILGTWDAHKTNSDEEFWQLTFNENTYVLSQVFAVPVVFIQGKAYVGGTKLDRTEGKVIDYLFSAESSTESLLVELKTPETKLLGAEYRAGVYAPSAELAGSIVQALTYRAELIQNLRSITEGTSHSLKTFNPRCVLVIGNYEAQLVDDARKRSFELFRASSQVEVVTYDELFRKVEILAELFSLKRVTKSS